MLFNSVEWFILLVKHALKSVIQRFKCISIVLNSQPCRFIDIYQLRILLSCLLFKATKQETFKFVVCLQIHFFSWNNCFKRLKVKSHTLNMLMIMLTFLEVINYLFNLCKDTNVREKKTGFFVCFLIRSFWNRFLETQTIQIVTCPN
jgi:hypothetical protein